MNSVAITEMVIKYKCEICGRKYISNYDAENCCVLSELEKLNPPFYWYYIKKSCYDEENYLGHTLLFSVGVKKDKDSNTLITLTSLGNSLHAPYRLTSSYDDIERLTITEAYDRFGVIPEFRNGIDLMMDYSISPDVSKEIESVKEKRRSRIRERIKDMSEDELRSILFSILSDPESININKKLQEEKIGII